QRMLKDRAFESGCLFNAELVTDQSDILREIADDYWRNRFFTGNPVVVSLAIEKGASPDMFLGLLQTLTNHPTMRVISGVEGESLDELEAALLEAFEAIRDCWKREKVAI